MILTALSQTKFSSRRHENHGHVDTIYFFCLYKSLPTCVIKKASASFPPIAPAGSSFLTPVTFDLDLSFTSDLSLLSDLEPSTGDGGIGGRGLLASRVDLVRAFSGLGCDGGLGLGASSMRRCSTSIFGIFGTTDDT